MVASSSVTSGEEPDLLSLLPFLQGVLDPLLGFVGLVLEPELETGTPCWVSWKVLFLFKFQIPHTNETG